MVARSLQASKISMVVEQKIITGAVMVLGSRKVAESCAGTCNIRSEGHYGLMT